MSENGLTIHADGKCRCFWAGPQEDYIRYHDGEWARPVADDVRLFEKVCLEGFQAGLSWYTILKKRENFRDAFHGFDFKRVAKMDERDVERLLTNAGIIRHSGKIEATINNACRALELIEEKGSLAAYFWSFEPKPSERPDAMTLDWAYANTTTDQSKALSKDLKKRGWKFVGPTTMYALMQAMGMVNDHLDGCFAKPLIDQARADFERPT